jgi:hypothetical protein
MKQQTFKHWTTTLSYYDFIKSYDLRMNDLEETKRVLSCSQKGKAFEDFIVSKFSDTHFSILDWRSDKSCNGRYPKTSKLPDLKMLLKTKSSKDTIFSVECKWRRSLPLGKLVLKNYQLENYRQYEKKTGKPVFIIVGLGGAPGNPESVYIIPLNEIHSTELTQLQLKKYERSGTGNLFLDSQNMVLK